MKTASDVISLIVALAGAMLGGTLVAVYMGLTLVGGALAMAGGSKAA